MTANELADLLIERAKWDGIQVPSNLDELCYAMLRQQAQEIEQLRSDLEDCTCQGGHSKAYLKAKGKL